MADTLAPAAEPGTQGLRVPRPWRPSPPGVIARLIVIAALVGFALSTPLMMPGIQINRLSQILVFVVVALSLNVLVGYAGQISLGHSAFVGVGAFTSGIVISEVGAPWLAGVGVAIVVGGAIAMVLGIVALRVRGLYLALVTLAYGLFAQFVIFPLDFVSRGGAGMPADRPAWAMEDLTYAYICLAAVALVWVLDWRLTSSRAGRAIQALRDSERVAASWGINVTGYKLLAFVISGMIAGLAGALFASIQELVSPLTFQFQLSLLFLFMVVVGGAGSRFGVVLGAVLLGSLEFLLDLADANIEDFPVDGSAARLLGALLVLVILLWFPGGIAQMLRGLIRWLSFKPWRAARGGDGAGAAAQGGADVRP